MPAAGAPKKNKQASKQAGKQASNAPSALKHLATKPWSAKSENCLKVVQKRAKAEAQAPLRQAPWNHLATKPWSAKPENRLESGSKAVVCVVCVSECECACARVRVCVSVGARPIITLLSSPRSSFATSWFSTNRSQNFTSCSTDLFVLFLSDRSLALPVLRLMRLPAVSQRL